jgi:glycosyltransferase involved in cell wall biosynthesis
LHLAVDATSVVPGHKGLGRFQARLLEELAAIAPAHVEGTVLALPAFRTLGATVPSGWQVEELRARRSLARDLLDAPRALRRTRPDVLLSTADRLRAVRGVPVVLYVFEDPHDRARMQAADPATGVRQRVVDRLTARWFRHTLRSATHVVAPSSSTASRLVERYALSPERVTVAIPGPFHEPDAWQGPSEDDPRVLVFIDRDVRDNGPVALRAFASAGPLWRLDVIGNTDPRVVALAAELGLSDRVTFHGRVTDERLRGAYAASQVYLDVSLHEGFGAQAVEAAAAGVPSVVSGVDSLPEVTQHRALYVDPRSVEDVATALRRLMDSPQERARAGAAFDRAELAARWPAAAAELIRLCRMVARDG